MRYPRAFGPLAFFGVLPTELMLGLFTSNIRVKFAATFVSMPGIYLVTEQPGEWLIYLTPYRSITKI